MNISFRKIGLWAGIIGALAIGAYFSFQVQPVPVDVAITTTGPMEVTIDADGVTRIKDVYEVAAPISGVVQRSPVDVGDFVKHDETLIAVIEPSQPVFLDARSRLQAEAAIKEAKAALELAKANIATAEANFQYAFDQHERVEALVASGSLSSTRLEETNLALSQAQLALIAAQTEEGLRQSTLERTEAMLIEPEVNDHSDSDTCCIQIFAPVDGNVLNIASISQRPILAGAPIMSIGSPDDLELVVDLLSSDVVNISKGASAYVERWGGENTLSATVSRIDPSAFTKISALGIAEQRVSVVLDIDTPKEERLGLGDGFRVFIRVVEWRGEDVMQIPISALFRKDDQWTVFTVNNGKAVAREVEIGHRNSSFAEVLGGLNIGDVVITHPSDRVSDGAAIIDRAEIE